MAYSICGWLACITLMLVHLSLLAAETIHRWSADLACSPLAKFRPCPKPPPAKTSQHNKADIQDLNACLHSL